MARRAASRFREMRWARPWRGAGNFRTLSAEALRRCRQTRRRRARRADQRVLRQRAKRRATKPPGLFTLSAKSRRSPAPSSRWIRTPDACSRSAAASVLRSASSTGRPKLKRQPGSSIKPFVYLTAPIDHGFTPSTLGGRWPDIAPARARDADVVLRPITQGSTTRPDSAARHRCASRSSNRSMRWTARGRLDGRDGSDRPDRRALRHHGPHAARVLDGAGHWRRQPCYGTPLHMRCWDNGGKRITPETSS